MPKLLTTILLILDSIGSMATGLLVSPQSPADILVSPAVAQQIRYQSPQPSLATGTVSLTIPLYKIEAEGLELPFSLVYQTSGIKPSDDPYPCGYGWSLTPALKVSRMVRGRPDEFYPYAGDDPDALYNDPSKAFAALCALDPGTMGGNNTWERLDTEKDIFTLSLPGVTLTRIVAFKGDNRLLKELTPNDDQTYSFSYHPLWNAGEEMMIDWWGYYNGRKTVDGSQDSTPRICIRTFETRHDPTGDFLPLGKADRRPDESFMQAGLLKSVRYPTGGYSSFEYEPHRFPPQRIDSEGNMSPESDPALDMGGGLRIRRILTMISDNDPDPHERVYGYDSAVVAAVPSAATFVGITNGLGLKEARTLSPDFYFYRIVNLMHESDYMRNRVGETAVWYRNVTEKCNEGKTEYTFSTLLPSDRESREWGWSGPIEMNNVFSKGPRMIAKKVFEEEGGAYKLVEEEVWEYELTQGKRLTPISDIVNTRVSRHFVQTAVETTEAPEFTNGDRLFYTTYIYDNQSNGYLPCPIEIELKQRFPLELYNGLSPYRVSPYLLKLQSERPLGRRLTHYYDNGSSWECERYDYAEGTGIITEVTRTHSGDDAEERIRYRYAIEPRAPCEIQMKSAVSPGSASAAYTISDDYPIRPESLVTAWYYDDYSFANGCQWLKPELAFPLGLNTGTSDCENLSIIGYDTFGRVTLKAEGVMGEQMPRLVTRFAYDYEGNPTNESVTLTLGGKIWTLKTDREYFGNGTPKRISTTFGGDSAVTVLSYGLDGKVKSRRHNGYIVREYAHDANGWITTLSVKAHLRGDQPLIPGIMEPFDPLVPITGTAACNVESPEFPAFYHSVYKEKIHRADAPSGVAPRYDGRISAKDSNGKITAYSYDPHRRLAGTSTGNADLSCTFAYDPNGNLTKTERRGIIDIIGGKCNYGWHTRTDLRYNGNRLTAVHCASEGEDYEGRTGTSVGLNGVLRGFTHDANGNLTSDPSRGIALLRYNRQNLPTDVYFSDGARQTTRYDGFGRKLGTSYSVLRTSAVVGDDFVGVLG